MFEDEEMVLAEEEPPRFGVVVLFEGIVIILQLDFVSVESEFVD